MKKEIFFFILLINIILINSEMNYLKLLNCLRNSEKVQNAGNKIIKNMKSDIFGTLLSLYSSLNTAKVDYKKCQRKANNSFEFDSICVLKCINKFQIDYDYSCLGSCYY